MNNSTTRQAVPAVAGKSISSAFVSIDTADVHGILLVFTDGTELSINFDCQTRVDAEILHYRWDDGEATMLDQTQGREASRQE